MNNGRLFAGIFAFLLVGGLLTPAFANPVEQITNGDFETGTFAGWTVSATGGLTINDGTFDPPGPLGTSPPISGSFDAMTFQGGPSLNMLSEPFVVPLGVQSANVNWNDRIYNHASVFSDPNQEVRVEIRDATGTIVLASIYDTNPGDPLIQAGPNARSFDITTALQSLEGQSVRLCFTQEDNLLFFNYIVDDVSLTIDTMVVGGEFLPLDTTALLMAGMAANLSMIVPIAAGIAGVGAFYIRSRLNKE